MRHRKQRRRTFSSTVLDGIRTVGSENEAAETTASAAHFARCHLTQLSCSAEMNSLATNSASFPLFIYLDLCSTGSTSSH